MPPVPRNLAIVLLVLGVVVIVAGVIGALTSGNGLAWLTPVVGLLLVLRAVMALRSKASGPGRGPVC